MNTVIAVCARSALHPVKKDTRCGAPGNLGRGGGQRPPARDWLTGLLIDNEMTQKRAWPQNQPTVGVRQTLAAPQAGSEEALADTLNRLCQAGPVGRVRHPT